jgi:hypothetical protein
MLIKLETSGCINAGCDSEAPDADARHCTSKRGKTHVTEAQEVLYPWHRWEPVQLQLALENPGKRQGRQSQLIPVEILFESRDGIGGKAN